MPYSQDEIAVQQRAGEREEAAALDGMVSDALDERAAGFLSRQRLIAVGAAEETGHLWATVLTGEPGFLRVVDEHRLTIEARPSHGEPLAAALEGSTRVGTLALEPATRRRFRVNGAGEPTAAGLRIRVEEAFGNCPKYIQQRTVEAVSPPGPTTITELADLTDRVAGVVGRADTFFLATHGRHGGVDVSHRGGAPGFVHVDGDTLVWPDYAGNSMYLSLGNLTFDPAAGVTVLDWADGSMLQLTGRATIDWDAAHAAALPGVRRLVRFTVSRALEVRGAVPFTWSTPEPSRYNPPPG